MKNPGSLQKYKETLNNLGLANLSRYDYHLEGQLTWRGLKMAWPGLGLKKVGLGLAWANL